ncbi:sensor histidine kinase [Bradyrhizobium sp. HKCCYLR20261]|uniref:sensor histidine kinase n=1 Tax=Bradyrhizobium sp. HKCCYLR20261 TaxID=3420760 RepID=UPI003EBC4474
MRDAPISARQMPSGLSGRWSDGTNPPGPCAPTADRRSDDARDGERRAGATDATAALHHYAAHISRELQHPLTSLVFDAEAALRWLRRPQADIAEAIRGLERIRDSALRATRIARSLRTVAARESPALAAVLIEDALDAVLRSVAKDLARHRIVVDRGVPATPKHVRADREQLQQVLLSLVANAIDAMADAAGDRVLTIAISDLGDTVRCSIADSGAGTAAEVRDAAFDPLFSTRPDRTGLGLTIARAIVEAHGGQLIAQSEPGGGSTLSFELGSAD